MCMNESRVCCIRNATEVMGGIVSCVVAVALKQFYIKGIEIFRIVVPWSKEKALIGFME